MKKVFLLMLLPAILGAANLSAQVTIGDAVIPDKFSLLDIVTTNMKKGVHLPRLDTAERDALISTTSEDSTAAKGLAVFNTTTNCYNVWSGKQWLSLCDADMNPLRITTQPAPFTWRRKYDVAGDPNYTTKPDPVTLTVVASGEGTLTYAWYEKPKNKNITTHGTKLASTASYAPDTTAWGMRTYYCVVSNGTDSVVSNYADVAVGCGAKTTDGNWLSFMCYNLGADTELPPFVYYSAGDTTSKDIKGWLFQWGRVADGHQWRSSSNVAGPIRLPNAGQVPSDSTTFYGNFITNTSRASYCSWHYPTSGSTWYAIKPIVDPCPEGWILPAISDFAGIVGESNNKAISPESATANTWLLVPGGYAILPNGIDTTLFFPLAGLRAGMSGAIASVGTMTAFWSRNTESFDAGNLTIDRGTLWPGVFDWQTRGHSVRCVKYK